MTILGLSLILQPAPQTSITTIGMAMKALNATIEELFVFEGE